jgi:RimJ/RimL family protein N-acetyltransferase
LVNYLYALEANPIGVQQMSNDIRKQFFPMRLQSGVTAHSMDRQAALKSIEIFNHRIFAPGFKETGVFRPPQARGERVARLWEDRVDTHPEWIVFFDEGEDPIGWFYGYMEDEETFFIDTIGLVPEVRRQGIYQTFLEQLIPYLKAVGYERLTSSHHPNNRAVLIAELKVGFNIVGLEINESVGPVLRVAHPLYEDRRLGFERVFHLVAEDYWDNT